ALHGIVAAALTQLSGGSSTDGLKAGAIGAITASAMTDHLVSALYGDKKSSDLTAEEKRLVSSLVSIAGGLAGAAVTDGSFSMAATASETAKVEVENNSLKSMMCAESPWDCRDNPLIEGGGSRGAYNPTGRSGNPMNTKGSNSPAVIGERAYSAHAVDRMQGRGVPPSAVENTIKTGNIYPTKPGTTGYYDATNNLRVIINTNTGDVVTVIPGAPTK
ncbi:VENN motif pre-toxin domain-containing protein, partial [Enterobacter asburiae]